MITLMAELRALWVAPRRALNHGAKTTEIPTVFAAPMGMEQGPLQAIRRGNLSHMHGQYLR